ncbi:flagellar basal body P-ring protein FlgI, partial [Candidatus Desantisbacteria bacterium]|nr:flagellar basal body P-ring protein FlgI [Candidatus Desantisbacteria bacterium]
DFTTASRMVKAIDDGFGAGTAIAVNAASIVVTIPSEYTDNIVGFISTLENLTITPDVVARVVINERTGTVVMGENLCILPVAVSHKDLYLVVTGEDGKQEDKGAAPTIIVSAPEIGTETMSKALGAININPTQEQIATVLDMIKQQSTSAGAESPTTPEAGGKGAAETKPGAQAAAGSQGKVVILSTRVKVGDVVKGLSSVGATPQDVIAVLQAIKAAGALQAEIIIM